MNIEFDVKMTTGKLYDYMLRHTFTSFSGILGEIVGIILLIGFFAYKTPTFLFGGILVTLYLPVALFANARKQVKLTPAFKQPLHYCLTEEGIEVTAGEAKDFQAWKDMVKAVSTNKNIIIYTSKVNACLFPREDLKEKQEDVIKMISSHMDPKKVNIRL